MHNLINRKLTAIFTLGFASGLPLALTGASLQAWFTNAGLNIKTIGALSLLGIPYTLKFLWAPLMDHYGLSPLGRRKSWILLMQLGLVVGLVLMSLFDPASNASTMIGVALLIAFFSASQDISINAYTTDVLTAEERGLGAAYTVFAYRVALLVSGGLALIAADVIGWHYTYFIMAVIMLLLMIPTYFAPHVYEVTSSTSSLYATMRAAVSNFWQRDKILLVLVFIVLYKFGDALALTLMTNFLLNGLHFSLTEVGVAYKTVSIVAMIIGGLVGGVLMTRMPLYRALLLFGIMQAFSNLTFAWLAIVGKQVVLMTISVFIENFCSGLSTAALFAFMMYLCDKRYTASQFALLSAVASLGRVFLGPLAAWMVPILGWPLFYFWSFVLCFPSLIILLFLKDEVAQHAAAAYR